MIFENSTKAGVTHFSIPAVVNAAEIIKLKSLINFNFKFQYFKFQTLLAVFFHLYKKLREI